jgi:hypothetical protein
VGPQSFCIQTTNLIFDPFQRQVLQEHDGPGKSPSPQIYTTQSNDMLLQEFDLVQSVHLHGAFSCTKAAWPHFRKQKFGRVINTASAAGLYGELHLLIRHKATLTGWMLYNRQHGPSERKYIRCILVILYLHTLSSIRPPRWVWSPIHVPLPLKVPSMASRRLASRPWPPLK